MKLWQKNNKTDKRIIHFCVGNDYSLDNNLIQYDVEASCAHAEMLKKIGILNLQEFNRIMHCLNEIKQKALQGNFKIKKDEEDCHTAIENYLVRKIGIAGKKLHTARSRNDQVMVALRLYAKDKIIAIAQAGRQLAITLLNFAQKYEFVPIPGFSHTRKAMPSSIGLWAGAFVESLIDDLGLLKAAYDLINQSPLGSAAGFGVSLPIDRELTAKLLSFPKVQKNTLYVQNSRGKFESIIVDALSNIILDLNKLATDLILFTEDSFGYFQLPEKICTGSSLMPNKKNPDVLELVRTYYKILVSESACIKNIIADLMSGYNRDYQLTKAPFLRAIEITSNTLEIMDIVINALEVNQEKCEQAFTKDLFATDEVMRKVQQGIPFRTAYRKVAKELHKIEFQDLVENLQSKKHTGAPGNLQLNALKTDLLSGKHKYQ